MNKKTVAGFAFGPIGAAAFGLITVPTIAWTFSPEDVGRLNIFQVTVSFCLLFSVLGLDQAYVREYHEVDDKAALFKACFTPGLLLLLLITFATIFFSENIVYLLYGSNNGWLYLITLAAVFVSYFSRFLSLILRMQERGLAFSMSQVLPKVLQLALVLGMAIAAFNKVFLHLLLASFISLTTVLALFAWNTRHQWQPALGKQINRSQLYKLLTFGFPLIFSGIAFWGINATSTFALRGLSSLSELAVYTVATSFAGAAAIIQSIFSLVWIPLVFKWKVNGVDMERVDIVAQQALAVVCTAVVVCGSFAWIADLLLPAQYSQVKYLIMCSIVQPLLYTMSVVTSIGIGIERRNILSLLVTIAALITNISLSFILIPEYGASGAAIANAIAFLVLFVANTEASARVWRQSPRRRIYFFVISAVVLSVITVLYGAKLPFHFSLAWATLIPGLYFCFRKQWVEIYKLVSK